MKATKSIYCAIIILGGTALILIFSYTQGENGMESPHLNESTRTATSYGGAANKREPAQNLGTNAHKGAPTHNLAITGDGHASEPLDALVDEANRKFQQNNKVLFVGNLVGRDTYLKGDAATDLIKIEEVLNSHLLNQLKDEFLISYLTAAGSSDFSRVKENVVKCAEMPSVNKVVIGEALRLLAFTDSTGAFETLLSLPWSESYGGPIASIVAHRVLENSTAGSLEVQNLKGRPSYEWAVAGLIHATRAVDPSSVAVWRNEIKSSNVLELADSITYTYVRKY